MEISCENETKTNGIKGSVVTIKADDGTVVEELKMPVRYGLDYCERHPNGKWGQRFQEAVQQAKGRKKVVTPKRPYAKGATTRKTQAARKPRNEAPMDMADWFAVDPETPPKRGDYWVSDGRRVWALHISKPTQLSSLVSILGVQYLKPIVERKPRMTFAS